MDGPATCPPAGRGPPPVGGRAPPLLPPRRRLPGECPLGLPLPPPGPRGMGGLLAPRPHPAGFLVPRGRGATLLARRPRRARGVPRGDGRQCLPPRSLPSLPRR